MILTRASLVAWTVKNLPIMQETWFQSLGQEDPLEKRMVTHSSILAWRIPWAEEHGRLYSPWGHKELDMTKQLTHTHVTSNRGKMVLPLFSTYSTYHLGAGALVGEFWINGSQMLTYRTIVSKSLERGKNVYFYHTDSWT